MKGLKKKRLERKKIEKEEKDLIKRKNKERKH